VKKIRQFYIKRKQPLFAFKYTDKYKKEDEDGKSYYWLFIILSFAFALLFSFALYFNVHEIKVIIFCSILSILLFLLSIVLLFNVIKIKIRPIKNKRTF
jgi:uncharacterized membrane protein